MHEYTILLQAMEDQSWIPNWRTDSLKVRELNDRLMMAERAFTDPDGLFQRTWYKHLVSIYLKEPLLLPYLMNLLCRMSNEEINSIGIWTLTA